jgi:rare lipoprotein A
VRGGHAATAVAKAASEVAVAVAERQVFAPLRQIDAWTHRRYATGEASYYAGGFEGRSTASGEPYRAAKYTAAHRTLPFGTLLRVTNERNGRSVVVRVNDRGPFHARRIVDLSRAAAAELGLVRRGRGQVRLDVLTR